MITADQLNDLARRASKDSLLHGYKDDRYPARRLLVKAACEVAEAIEAKRRNKIADMHDYEMKVSFASAVSLTREARDNAFRIAIKDTVQDEMADVIIYILVAIGHFYLGKYTDEHIERSMKLLPNFNEVFDVEQDFVSRAGIVMKYLLQTSPDMIDCIVLVEAWLKRETKEDIWYFVREKMEFNKKRPYLHGIMRDGVM